MRTEWNRKRDKRMGLEQEKEIRQKKIVQIEDLSVAFDGMEVVKHVNIEVNSGEIVGIVGESGSGKSITSLTLMGLLSKQAQVTSGKIIVDGEVLREAGRPCDEKLYRKFQGSRMSMVFQEPKKRFFSWEFRHWCCCRIACLR